MSSMLDLFNSATGSASTKSVASEGYKTLDRLGCLALPVDPRSKDFIEIRSATTPTGQRHPVLRMLNSMMHDLFEWYEVWEFRCSRGKVR